MGRHIIDAGRWLTATSVLLTGAVHLRLWAEGYRDVPAIGPLFLLNAGAALVIVVAVLRWRHWLPLLAAAGLGATTAAAFWASVVHGLAGVRENPSGTVEIVAQIAEYAATLAGLTAAGLLLRQRSEDSDDPRWRAGAPHPGISHRPSAGGHRG